MAEINLLLSGKWIQAVQEVERGEWYGASPSPRHPIQDGDTHSSSLISTWHISVCVKENLTFPWDKSRE